MHEEFTRNPADLKIGDLLPNRPIVGNEISVVLWRLVRVVGLYSILEEEAENVSYFTGKKIGKILGAKNIDELHRQLTDLKIGKLDFSVSGSDLVHMAIEECLTCAGITPPLGKPICQLEVGIVAGALENIYEGRKVSAYETKCIGGRGEDVCLVECRII